MSKGITLHFRSTLSAIAFVLWVGRARRELLDYVIIPNENHLRQLLHEYVDYYNADRVPTRLRDLPIGRPTEHRPSLDAQIVGKPRVDGLHHRYEWQEAA
jgi:putative transposase